MTYILAIDLISILKRLIIDKFLIDRTISSLQKKKTKNKQRYLKEIHCDSLCPCKKHIITSDDQ